jgi:hypothetical protein
MQQETWDLRYRRDTHAAESVSAAGESALANIVFWLPSFELTTR